MSYDDTPYYKRESPDKTLPAPQNSGFSKPSVPWSSQVMGHIRSSPRGATVSSIQLWWEQEGKLRANGLENEIDHNEIMVAMKGARNRWSDRVKKYPEKFQAYIDKKPYKWEDILCI